MTSGQAFDPEGVQDRPRPTNSVKPRARVADQMLDMPIEPTLEDQELLEETLRRRRTGISVRERVALTASTVTFFGAVAGVWSIQPPHAFAIVPMVVSLLVLALAIRVRFDTPLGFTVPTQLGFVPLVASAPAAVVPLAVTIAFVLAMGPDVIVRRIRPSRLLYAAMNSWFSIGPVLVLAIAHVEPRAAGRAVLLAALAAQFVIDFAASGLYVAITRDGAVGSLLRDSWVYGIDAALTAPGLLAAASIDETPLAALAMVPLLGLMAVFAHERHRRLESSLELSSAYRGTACAEGRPIVGSYP